MAMFHPENKANALKYDYCLNATDIAAKLASNAVNAAFDATTPLDPFFEVQFVRTFSVQVNAARIFLRFWRPRHTSS